MKIQIDGENYISKSVVMNSIGTSGATVMNRINEGDVRAKKIGNEWFILEDDAHKCDRKSAWKNGRMVNPIQNGDTFSLTDIAKMSFANPGTVAQHIKRGSLKPAVREGGRVDVSRPDAVRFLDQRRDSIEATIATIQSLLAEAIDDRTP